MNTKGIKHFAKITALSITMVLTVAYCVEGVALFALSLAVVSLTDRYLSRKWVSVAHTVPTTPDANTILKALNLSLSSGVIMAYGPHTMIPLFLMGSTLCVMGMVADSIRGGRVVTINA